MTIDYYNSQGSLHVQSVTEEPKASGGLVSFGTFSGVRNSFVLTGMKAAELDERKLLVLLSQTLGLKTRWDDPSYSKIPGAYGLGAGTEKPEWA